MKKSKVPPPTLPKPKKNGGNKPLEVKTDVQKSTGLKSGANVGMSEKPVSPTSPPATEQKVTSVKGRPPVKLRLGQDGDKPSLKVGAGHRQPLVWQACPAKGEPPLKKSKDGLSPKTPPPVLPKPAKAKQTNVAADKTEMSEAKSKAPPVPPKPFKSQRSHEDRVLPSSETPKVMPLVPQTPQKPKDPKDGQTTPTSKVPKVPPPVPQKPKVKQGGADSGNTKEVQDSAQFVLLKSKIPNSAMTANAGNQSQPFIPVTPEPGKTQVRSDEPPPLPDSAPPSLPPSAMMFLTSDQPQMSDKKGGPPKITLDAKPDHVCLKQEPDLAQASGEQSSGTTGVIGVANEHLIDSKKPAVANAARYPDSENKEEENGPVEQVYSKEEKFANEAQSCDINNTETAPMEVDDAITATGASQAESEINNHELPENNHELPEKNKPIQQDVANSDIEKVVEIREHMVVETESFELVEKEMFDEFSNEQNIMPLGESFNEKQDEEPSKTLGDQLPQRNDSISKLESIEADTETSAEQIEVTDKTSKQCDVEPPIEPEEEFEIIQSEPEQSLETAAEDMSSESFLSAEGHRSEPVIEEKESESYTSEEIQSNEETSRPSQPEDSCEKQEKSEPGVDECDIDECDKGLSEQQIREPESPLGSNGKVLEVQGIFTEVQNVKAVEAEKEPPVVSEAYDSEGVLQESSLDTMPVMDEGVLDKVSDRAIEQPSDVSGVESVNEVSDEIQRTPEEMVIGNDTCVEASPAGDVSPGAINSEDKMESDTVADSPGDVIRAGQSLDSDETKVLGSTEPETLGNAIVSEVNSAKKEIAATIEPCDVAITETSAVKQEVEPECGKVLVDAANADVDEVVKPGNHNMDQTTESNHSDGNETPEQVDVLRTDSEPEIPNLENQTVDQTTVSEPPIITCEDRKLEQMVAMDICDNQTVAVEVSENLNVDEIGNSECPKSLDSSEIREVVNTLGTGDMKTGTSDTEIQNFVEKIDLEHPNLVDGDKTCEQTDLINEDVEEMKVADGLTADHLGKEDTEDIDFNPQVSHEVAKVGDDIKSGEVAVVFQMQQTDNNLPKVSLSELSDKDMSSKDRNLSDKKEPVLPETASCKLTQSPQPDSVFPVMASEAEPIPEVKDTEVEVGDSLSPEVSVSKHEKDLIENKFPEPQVVTAIKDTPLGLELEGQENVVNREELKASVSNCNVQSERDKVSNFDDGLTKATKVIAEESETISNQTTKPSNGVIDSVNEISGAKDDAPAIEPSSPKDPIVPVSATTCPVKSGVNVQVNSPENKHEPVQVESVQDTPRSLDNVDSVELVSEESDKGNSKSDITLDGKSIQNTVPNQAPLVADSSIVPSISQNTEMKKDLTLPQGQFTEAVSNTDKLSPEKLVNSSNTNTFAPGPLPADISQDGSSASGVPVQEDSHEKQVQETPKDAPAVNNNGDAKVADVQVEPTGETTSLSDVSNASLGEVKKAPASDVKDPPVSDVKEEPSDEDKNTSSEVKNTPTGEEEEVSTDVKEAASTDVKQEVSTDVRQEVSTDVKQEALTDLKETASTDVKETASTDVKEAALTDVKQEASTDVKQEVSTDVKQEALTDLKKTASIDVKKAASTDVKDAASTDVNEGSTDVKEAASTDVKEAASTDVKEVSTDVKEATTDVKEEASVYAKEAASTDVKQETSTDVKQEASTDVKEAAPTYVKQSTSTEEVKDVPVNGVNEVQDNTSTAVNNAVSEDVNKILPSNIESAPLDDLKDVTAPADERSALTSESQPIVNDVQGTVTDITHTPSEDVKDGPSDNTDPVERSLLVSEPRPIVADAVQTMDKQVVEGKPDIKSDSGEAEKPTETVAQLEVKKDAEEKKAGEKAKGTEETSADNQGDSQNGTLFISVATFDKACVFCVLII